MSEPSSSERDVVLDACLLINLVASGIAPGHLARLARAVLHVTRVVAKEVHYLLPSEPNGPRTPIDVQELLAGGQLRSVDLTASEVARYVDLAGDLDDGEATALAVACERGWSIATDDRKARRVASTKGVGLLGTSELIKPWADEKVRAVRHRLDRAGVRRVHRHLRRRTVGLASVQPPHLTSSAK